jgi:hypothetical protein
LFVWVTFLHFPRDFEQQVLGVDDIAWNAVWKWVIRTKFEFNFWIFLIESLIDRTLC